MRVFNVAMKILKKGSIGMLVYILVFIIVSAIFAFSGDSQDSNSVEISKKNIKISIMNYQKKEPFIGLEKYLEKQYKIIKIKDNKEIITENLVNGYIDYVLKIEKDGQLKYYAYNNTETSALISQSIEEYCRIYSTFEHFKHDAPEYATNNILSKNAVLSIVSEKADGKKSLANKMLAYYKFLSFVVLSILMMGIYLIQSRFNKPELKNRISVSGADSAKINVEIFISALAFTFLVWLCFAVFSVFFFGIDNMLFGYYGPRYLLTLFVGLLPLSTLAFLIASISKSMNMNNILVNTVSLSLAFLSGIFVPMEIMPKIIERIAVISPLYWYSCACSDVCDGNFGLVTTGKYFLIQAAMSLVLLAITLFILRNRKRNQMN